MGSAGFREANPGLRGAGMSGPAPGPRGGGPFGEAFGPLEGPLGQFCLNSNMFLSLGEDRSGTPNPKLKLWVCEWEYEDEEDEEEACWSFWGVVGSAKGILVVLDQFSITYYNASAPSRTDIVICECLWSVYCE